MYSRCTGTYLEDGKVNCPGYTISYELVAYSNGGMAARKNDIRKLRIDDPINSYFRACTEARIAQGRHERSTHAHRALRRAFSINNPAGNVLDISLGGSDKRDPRDRYKLLCDETDSNPTCDRLVQKG